MNSDRYTSASVSYPVGLEPADEGPAAELENPLEAKIEQHGSSKKLDSKLLQTLIVMGFGGALLARYYAFIGHIPEIEWKESLTYISVLVLGGAGLLALYGLLLFLPGVIWSEVLVCERELQGLLCFKNQRSRREPCPVGISKAIGLPFLLFLLIAHVPMFWGGEAGSVFAAGLIGLVPALVILRHYLHKELKHIYPLRSRRSLLTRYLSFFSLSALVSLASMVVIYQLLSPHQQAGAADQEITRRVMMPGACLLISVLANVLVALQFRLWRTRAAVTGIVAAFLLFLAGESIPIGEQTLSARILAQFGLGPGSEHIAEYTLFPDHDGAMLAASLQLGSGDSRDGAIAHVHILSALGKTYYLEVGNRRVVFPKEMVRAWETPVPPAD